MADVADQKRVLQTITGPIEKPALVWMSERMPAWVTPDILTGLGILGSMVVFAGFALSHASPAWVWFSAVGLVINWVGDSTDGTLARVRHIERPKYGFFVDHTMDVISEGFIIVGIGVSPFVRLDVALLAYAAYLGMSVLAYVRAFVDGVFKISYSRVGPTELRIVLVAVIAVMYFYPEPSMVTESPALTAYDLAVLLVALGLAAAFVASTFQGLRRLADADKPRG